MSCPDPESRAVPATSGAPDSNARAAREFWDDPGGLIESWLRRGQPEPHTPDALLVAWLAILPPSVPPPLAARSLLARLAETGPDAGATMDRRRLLDLLGHVARYAPTANANTPLTERGSP